MNNTSIQKLKDLELFNKLPLEIENIIIDYIRLPKINWRNEGKICNMRIKEEYDNIKGPLSINEEYRNIKKSFGLSVYSDIKKTRKLPIIGDFFIRKNDSLNFCEVIKITDKCIFYKILRKAPIIESNIFIGVLEEFLYSFRLSFIQKNDYESNIIKKMLKTKFYKKIKVKDDGFLYEEYK